MTAQAVLLLLCCTASQSEYVGPELVATIVTKQRFLLQEKRKEMPPGWGKLCFSSKNHIYKTNKWINKNKSFVFFPAFKVVCPSFILFGLGANPFLFLQFSLWPSGPTSHPAPGSLVPWVCPLGLSYLYPGSSQFENPLLWHFSHRPSWQNSSI